MTTILFVLKLVHLIDWPWLWVFAPALAEAALFLAILAVGFIAEFWQEYRFRQRFRPKK